MEETNFAPTNAEQPTEENCVWITSIGYVWYVATHFLVIGIPKLRRALGDVGLKA